MVAEVSGKHPTTEIFRNLAQLMTGRAEMKKQKAGLLAPLLSKLRKQS
jgi:pilus assembly protein CpaE